MTNRNLRYSGLGLAVLTAGAVAACSSDSGTPVQTAGTGSTTGGAQNGTAGSGGPGGASTAGAFSSAGTGVGGSAAGAAPTAGGGGGAGYTCAGTIPASALITDFSNLTPSTSMPGNFTFTGQGVVGGTLSYQANALTLDTMTNTVLNVKGNVHDYDGFGLYFDTCYDASAYTGVSFNVKGNVGPSNKLTLRVQTNSNTAVGTADSPKGTCVPTNTSNTYPDCHGATYDITVPAAGGVVTVLFTQLAGGMPVATVSPKEITGLEWAFQWTPPPAGTAGAGAGGASGGTGGASGGTGGASAGAAGAKGGAGGASGGTAGAGGAAAGPYDANVTIDDVMFIGGPPAGGAGGSGGASAGAAGASAGAGGAIAGAGGTGGKAGAGGSGGKAGTGG